jgi:hypothetical protein
MKLIITEIQYKSVLSKKIETLRKLLTKFCLVGRDKYIDGQCPNDKRGMNLQTAIDKVLDKEKTLIPESTFKNNKKGAGLLLKYKKINEEQYNNFINKLKYKRQVFIDNEEWHPVNKLNTNYTDVSILLSDLLIDTYKENKLDENLSEKLKTIFISIMNTNNFNEIKNILMSNQEFLWNLLVDTYKTNPRKLFDYAKSTIKNTKTGEDIENEVRTYLENEMKWIFGYQGGNGDYVDMNFSVDLIMKDNKGDVKSIQIKSNRRDANEFFEEYRTGLHQAVDMVIYPGNDEYYFINLKE